jgi:hypothetical protein
MIAAMDRHTRPRTIADYRRSSRHLANPAVVDFIPVHLHARRRIDANPNGMTTDAENLHRNAAVDHDLLPDAPRQN